MIVGAGPVNEGGGDFEDLSKAAKVESVEGLQM